MRCAILSPSSRSLYTAAVAWLLARDGHQVTDIIVRRMASRARVRSEWRAGPSKLLAKLVRRGLRLPARRDDDASLFAYCRANAVPTQLDGLCRALGARRVSCANFDDPAVEAALTAAAPELVFFTGGGMVRRPVLRAAGAGVVNCHIGPLPAYRGVDVIEWPLLVGDPCALTCHFMDEGLDTGPIVLERRILVSFDDTIASLRIKVEPMMVDAMRQVAARFAAGTLRSTRQRPEDGRQYFSMHPRLVPLAQSALSRLAADPAPQAARRTPNR